MASEPAPVSIAGLGQAQGLKRSAVVWSRSGPDKQSASIQLSGESNLIATKI